MPKGKGTYGKQVGRPRKEEKNGKGRKGTKVAKRQKSGKKQA